MVPCAASLLLALHGGHVALAVVPRGPTNNSDLKAGGPAFNHSFAKHANKTAGALACQATCDAQPRCRAWTYVPYGDAPSGPESHERCCLFPRLGCPVDRQGVVSGAKTAGSCSRPPPPPPGPPAPPPPGPPAPPTPLPLYDATRAMLFMDSHWIASSTNATATIGESFLLGAYEDPTAYIGWGYPAVFRLPAGGYRALFEGWANKSFHGTRMVLAADSTDGVVFHPLNVSREPPAKWPPSFSYNCSLCPLHKCSKTCGSSGPPFWPSNAVLGPIAGFSFAFDDAPFGVPAAQRLKALMKEGASVYSSPDGLTWDTRFAQWSARNVDPGFAVFRNPLNTSEVVVTARPQGMRASGGGRHAGFNAGLGWQGLKVGGLAGEPPGGLLNQALPLDLLYADDVQSYGLPSFSYGDMVVSWWWRLRDGNCSTTMPLTPGMDVPSCGTVSAALAYSYNSRNWSAFGQTEACTSRWAKDGVAELFPNVPGRRDAMQTYPNTLLEVDGRLLVHASAATHVHGFVAPGASSMLTYEMRLDGFVYLSPNESASDASRASGSAGLASASLITKAILWRGGDLLINADAKRSEGSAVSVGILDPSGTTIPGYECSGGTFTGNSTAVAWVWSGGKRMDSLTGRHVAISVTLTGGARLYSLRGDFASLSSEEG